MEKIPIGSSNKFICRVLSGLPHDLHNLHTDGENKEIHQLIWFGKNAK